MQSPLFAFSAILLLLPAVVFSDDRFNNDIEMDYPIVEDRRAIMRCVSSRDCGRNQCSVMGMQRYSEPRCEVLGGLGSPCRMYDNQPENKTLSFPHATMECENVYMQFCPCASGLVCREAVCSRQPRRRPEGSIISYQRNPSNILGRMWG